MFERQKKFFDGEKYCVIKREDFVGLNVGYECSVWRYKAFTNFLFSYLVPFATSASRRAECNSSTCWEMIVQAANIVYSSKKYNSRGEFGELLLYAILREQFDTEPIVSKLFLKTSANETVKGFDSVHARENEDGEVELWLGEVKFYSDINKAVASVTDELDKHLSPDKLREEFICVGPHVEKGSRYEAAVMRLLDGGTSLDDVFPVICIPVLLTYDSKVVGSAKETSEDFLHMLRDELEGNFAKFKKKCPSVKVKVRLILLPLESKERLSAYLDSKLKALQK